MLEANVLLIRKAEEIEYDACAAEKVIELSGGEFDRFSQNLLDDWDFIRENPVEIMPDTDGRCHCLLVLGEGREDGILVDADGGSYARHSALLPNARTLLAADRYPYLAERTRQLVAAADHIVSLISDHPKHFSVSFRTLSEKFGVSFAPFDSVTDMFQMMLCDRTEIDEVRCGAQEFFIDAAPMPEKEPVLIPAGAEENEKFYRNDDDKLCVGYLRGDFGRSGDEFHHTWSDGSTGRNTPEFKAEFQSVMDILRMDVLKDRDSSTRYCYRRPAAKLPDGDGTRYGFKLETADREYFVRCTTLRDDYFYIFIYDKAPMPEKDLSAAAVTHEDMRAYGYTWDGMEPMDKDEALGLWDANQEVYLLYPDGTETAAESRDDIAGFDGLFGREIAQRENEKTNAEKPSVLEQIREARKAPPAPRKQKDERGKGGPDL